MPQPTAHGDLDCTDAEALLTEAATENARLRQQVEDLNRRLDNALAQKHIAIREAVAARTR